MANKKNGQNRRPSALSIAGSDSGGGAGIQADLKTFEAIGVHGTTAITCITAQNPREVRSVQAVRSAVVRDQIDAVMAEFAPVAVKTGMLYSTGIIDTVAQAVAGRTTALIIDPVMVASSGAILLRRSAIAALKSRLLPLADLVTPNVPETEFLLGRTVATPEDLRAAAREIHARFGCATLVKGGHLGGLDQAIDFFCDGTTELMLQARYIANVSTHGTGCTYSAAIAAHCALGKSLADAVIAAKEFISNAIASSYRAGVHSVLNSFWHG